MSGKLEIRTTADNGYRVIEVQGDVDMESSPKFLAAIQDCLKNRSPMKLDLSGVKYMDSSGIAVLIQGYKQALKKSVEYLLRNPSSQVQAVIELSQLQGFFKFESAE